MREPADTESHASYSKRAMALDQVEVMRTLGFDRFAVVGHDLGARVAWRLAVEHPERISCAVVIDIVPLPYANVTREFATEYYQEEVPAETLAAILPFLQARP